MVRNQIEIGGVCVGFMAIILLLILPIQYRNDRMAVTQLCMEEMEIDRFLNSVNHAECVTKENIDELFNSISQISEISNIEIIIGNKIWFDNGHKDKYGIEMLYTSEIMKIIEAEGYMQLDSGSYISVICKNNYEYLNRANLTNSSNQETIKKGRVIGI